MRYFYKPRGLQVNFKNYALQIANTSISITIDVVSALYIEHDAATLVTLMHCGE